MPAISPNAFAPPVASDQVRPATLREQVRRLERAHSVQRAARKAVPLGLPAIDRCCPTAACWPGRCTRSRQVRAVRPGSRPRWRGARLYRHPDGPAGPRHPPVVPPAVGDSDATPYAPALARLVRPGAPPGGDGQARRGGVLGDGGRAARPGIAAVWARRARPTPRRPPAVARRQEERRAGPAAARPAGAAAKRLRDALAGRLGALARSRSRPLAPRSSAQSLRRSVGRRPPRGWWSGPMKRVVSLWFPKLSTDRLARTNAKTGWLGPPPLSSGATAARASSRSTRTPAPPASARTAPGRCAHPGARPRHHAGRARGRPRLLETLAGWCDRYTPWVAIDPLGAPWPRKAPRPAAPAASAATRADARRHRLRSSLRRQARRASARCSPTSSSA